MHREALKFCFIPVIQRELDNFTNEWNSHYIRDSRLAETAGGIPDILFYCPEQFGNYSLVLHENNFLFLLLLYVQVLLIINAVSMMIWLIMLRVL